MSISLSSMEKYAHCALKLQLTQLTMDDLFQVINIPNRSQYQLALTILFLRLIFLLGKMFQNELFGWEKFYGTRIWTLRITCGKWLKSNITRSLKFQFKWCSCGFSLSRTLHLFKSSSLFIKMLIYHFLENIFTEKIIFLINLPDHR